MRLQSIETLRAVLTFLLLGPTTLVAQPPAVSGIVRHTQTGNPIECLHVALADSLGRTVSHTVTDAAGTFVVVAPDTGNFRVRFMVPYLEAIRGPLLHLTAGLIMEQLYPVSFDEQVALDLDRRPTEPAEDLGDWHSAKASGGTMPGYGYREVTRGEAAYSSTLGYDQQRVVGEYIVEANGRPRSSSWRTIASSNPNMMQKGRSLFLRQRYEPARIGQQPVCELHIMEMKWFRHRSVQGP